MTSTGVTKKVVLFLAMLAAVAAVRGAAAQTTCPNLYMTWHDPVSGAVLRSDPYVCGTDLCAGYRCKVGTEISPACYDSAQCAAACGGECVYVPTAQLDCQTMCSTGSGASSCDVVMTWYKRKTLIRSEPYDCTADACAGLRCLNGNEISPACYSASECSRSCKTGTCVDIPTLQQGDCNATLCGAS